MNDFKNAYQSAVEDMDKLGMKKCHIDASLCMDEGRHRRRMMKRMRRTVTTTFSAMCVVFVCGFGTVKAAEYLENVIKVNEWGFESADMVTMVQNVGQDAQIHVTEETAEVAVVEEAESAQSLENEVIAEQAPEKDERPTEPVPAEETGAKEEAVAEAAEVEQMSVPTEATEQKAASADTQTKEQAETEDMRDGLSISAQQTMASAGPKEDEWVKIEGVERTATYPDLKSKQTTQSMSTGEAPAEEAVVEDIPVKKYTSWEDFEANEKIVFAQPDGSIGTLIENTDITVCGDWAMVRYDVDGRILWLERTDYADTQGHAASKVFPGGVCNERTYTTPAGYTYTLIDSVKASEGEPLQIHAAITVGSYEAYIDFSGYTEEDAKKIMDSIDLSVYE